MWNPCTSLEQLSADGNWDDVFYCLNIDANSTIELGGLRVLSNQDDSWLDDQKATTNSLELILFIILLFDQIFYLALLWYLLLFGFKFLGNRGLETLRKVKLRLLSEILVHKKPPPKVTAKVFLMDSKNKIMELRD